MRMLDDEDLLLTVLNSRPVIGGCTADGLVGTDAAALARELGGEGSESELAQLRDVRDALQRVIRGDEPAEEALAGPASGVALVPVLTRDGIRWDIDAPADKRVAARVLIAWSDLQHKRPGRLRACANTECNLYLIDRSRPGTAKWCSMATCGNRMKARAHAQRARQTEPQLR